MNTVSRSGVPVKEMTRLENHYLFANIKGILTFLLVTYHFISSRLTTLTSTQFTDVGVGLVVAFSPIILFVLAASPLFVMISGYGSKDTLACRNTAFSMYFVPYLALTVVMVLEFAIFNGLPIYIIPLEPLMQLWYLLSMFIWMQLLHDIVNIRFILPIALIMALVNGMVINNPVFAVSSGLGTFLSLSRTVYLLPFLLIGYKLSKADISKIRSMNRVKTILIAAAFLVLSVVLVMFCYNNGNIGFQGLLMLKGDNPYYKYIGNTGDGTGFNTFWETNFFGVIITVAFFVVAALATLLIFKMVPAKKIPFLTKLGNASLTVYCLHIFIVIPLSGILSSLSLPIALIFGYVLSFGICILLSLDPVNRAYTKIIFALGEIIKKK